MILWASPRTRPIKEKASIWLNIALAEEKLKHTDLAIKAAAEVQRFASQGSSAKLHAIAIEAGQTLKGAQKRKRLITLEKQARKEGHLSLAATITLDLTNDMDEPAEEIRLLNRVLETKGMRGYNQTRAVVAKARAVERMQNPQARACKEFCVNGFCDQNSGSLSSNMMLN